MFVQFPLDAGIFVGQSEYRNFTCCPSPTKNKCKQINKYAVLFLIPELSKQHYGIKMKLSTNTLSDVMDTTADGADNK